MIYEIECPVCEKKWALEMPPGWARPMRNLCPDCYEKYLERVRLEKQRGRHQLGKK